MATTIKTLTEIKRESKTYEALQQAVMLGLLNEVGFSFDLKCPERIANKTLQNLTIIEVFFKGEPLGFGKKIEEYCTMQYERDSDGAVTPNEIKVAKRRKDLNRAALSFNWLVHYAEQYGYCLARRQTKQPKKTLQMEKIKEISFGKTILYSEKQISEIGRKIHMYFLSCFQQSPTIFHLRPYDNFCDSLMKAHHRLNETDANDEIQHFSN